MITVFGCGGDRDRGKRPKMGRAAGEGSDFVVITSDNPRSEDPLAIIEDSWLELRAHGEDALWPSRTAARQLRWRWRKHKAGDIVLLAGKGHERTQTTREGVFPFDDHQVASEELQPHGIPARRRTRMKLSLSRVAEFTQGSGSFDHAAIAEGYSHRHADVAPGRAVLRHQRRAAGWP